MKQLRVGVRFLQELQQQKIKCYLHCERGHGRAPTLVAAYLITQGKTVEEAIRFIKRKRPAVHPNHRQRAQLQRWQKEW
ncbi:MAG: dual specificity protein phosphatase family protein [Nanoarchaeota archaeon]